MKITGPSSDSRPDPHPKMQETGVMGAHTVKQIPPHDDEWNKLMSMHGKEKLKTELTPDQVSQVSTDKIAFVAGAIFQGIMATVGAAGGIAMIASGIAFPPFAPFLIPLSVLPFLLTGIGTAAAISIGVFASQMNPPKPESEEWLKQNFSNFDNLQTNLSTFSKHGVDESILKEIHDQKPIYNQAKENYSQQIKESDKQLKQLEKEYRNNIRETNKNIKINRDFLDQKSGSLEDNKTAHKEIEGYIKEQEILKEKYQKSVGEIESQKKDYKNDLDKVGKNCFDKVVAVSEKVRDKEIEKQYEAYKNSQKGEIEPYDSFHKSKLEMFKQRGLTIMKLAMYYQLATK